MKSLQIGMVCRTLTEAYARFGIRITAPRTAWPAQAGDGRVVVTLWSNSFADADRRIYDLLDAPLGRWSQSAAHKRRTEHLRYARTHNGGLFDSIIVTQSSDETYERIVSREIGPRMRLGQLDEAGRFRAERTSTDVRW